MIKKKNNQFVTTDKTKTKKKKSKTKHDKLEFFITSQFNMGRS